MCDIVTPVWYQSLVTERCTPLFSHVKYLRYLMRELRGGESETHVTCRPRWNGRFLYTRDGHRRMTRYWQTSRRQFFSSSPWSSSFTSHQHLSPRSNWSNAIPMEMILANNVLRGTALTLLPAIHFSGNASRIRLRLLAAILVYIIRGSGIMMHRFKKDILSCRKI